MKGIGRAALLLLSACSQAPTLLIENTSGKPQTVDIASAGLYKKDVFLQDTIASGATLCWLVPEAARDTLLGIMLGDLNALRFDDVFHYLHIPFYSDSLDLRRSQRIQIHTPRFAAGSPAWDELVKKVKADRRKDRQLGFDLGISVADELAIEERAFRIPPGGGIETSQASRHFTNVDITPSRRCKAAE